MRGRGKRISRRRGNQDPDKHFAIKNSHETTCALQHHPRNSTVYFCSFVVDSYCFNICIVALEYINTKRNIASSSAIISVYLLVPLRILISMNLLHISRAMRKERGNNEAFGEDHFGIMFILRAMIPIQFVRVAPAVALILLLAVPAGSVMYVGNIDHMAEGAVFISGLIVSFIQFNMASMWQMSVDNYRITTEMWMDYNAKLEDVRANVEATISPNDVKDIYNILIELSDNVKRFVVSALDPGKYRINRGRLSDKRYQLQDKLLNCSRVPGAKIDDDAIVMQLDNLMGVVDSMYVRRTNFMPRETILPAMGTLIWVFAIILPVGLVPVVGWAYLIVEGIALFLIMSIIDVAIEHGDPFRNTESLSYKSMTQYTNFLISEMQPKTQIYH